MDQRTAATKERARRIIAECAPDDLTVFDDTVDGLLADLPQMRAGGTPRDKPTEFGGIVLYSLFQLAVLLAASLPNATADVMLTKAWDKAAAKRRERRRTKQVQADELLTVQVSRTRGQHPATVVHIEIAGQLYPAAVQSAIALLSYIAEHGDDDGHADIGEELADNP